jgi:hypothetical protein
VSDPVSAADASALSAATVDRAGASVAVAAPRIRRTPGLSWALFACVFTLLGLSAGAHPITSDSLQMCDAARNLVRHHKPYLSSMLRDDIVIGRDQRYYTKYPLLAVVGCVPTVWFEIAGGKRRGEGTELQRYLLGLGPASLGALAALGFFFLAWELGFSEFLAALGTLLLVFTTPLWHYARSAYSENIQVVITVWAIWCWVRARGRAPAGLLLVGGFLVGLAPSAKVLLVILAVAVVLDRLFDRWDTRQWLRVALFAGIGVLPGWLAFRWYNELRFGAALRMGYTTGRDGALGFSGPVVSGLHGLLFSPGKSIFLYAPLLLLIGVGIRAMFVRRPRDLVLLGVPVVFVFVMVAKWWCWSGDAAWGPRLVVPVVPLLFVPVLEALRSGGRALRVFASGLALVGLYVSLLGVSIRAYDYVGLAESSVHRGLGRFDPDVDKVRDELLLLHFVPELSPIVGHHWMLWRYLRKETWDGRSYYPWRSANIPSWHLRKDPGPHELNFWFSRRPKGTLLFASLSCATAALAWLAARMWRARQRGGS